MSERLGPQFRFTYKNDPDEYTLDNHTLLMHKGTSPEIIGSMSWANHGALQEIQVDPQHRRRGLATRMWTHAQELSQKDPNIPEPEPSNFRTPDGDAWAQAIYKRGLSDEPPYNQYED